MKEGHFPMGEQVHEQAVLSPREQVALKLVREHASTAAERFPHMGDDFASGMTHEEIAEKYDFSELFGVTPLIATSIARAAVREQLGEERYQDLVALHRSAKSRRGAAVLEQNRSGIYGLSPQERSAVGKKGGEAAVAKGAGALGLTAAQHAAHGYETKRRGVGIHALTHDQLSAIGTRNKELGLGIHGLTAADHKVAGERLLALVEKDSWKGSVDPESGMTEAELCFSLSRRPDFQFPRGSSNAGRPDATKIAAELNRVFPPITGTSKAKARTNSAVRNFLHRQRHPSRFFYFGILLRGHCHYIFCVDEH